MRVLAWAILGFGTILAAASAQAQTYNPNYPVCLQNYGPWGGGFIDCRYTSLAQCNASASGRPAQCYANPFFAYGNEAQPGRPNRRLRGVQE